MTAMTRNTTRDLQDTFLRHVQDQGVPVTMFLVNGVKRQGYISHYDKFGVALTRDRHTQFVYKHAISTINPLPAIQLFDRSEEVDHSE